MRLHSRSSALKDMSDGHNGYSSKPMLTFDVPYSFKRQVTGPLPKCIRDHVVATGARDSKHPRSVEEVILRKRFDASQSPNKFEGLRKRLVEDRKFVSSSGPEKESRCVSLTNGVKRVLSPAPRTIPTAEQWRVQQQETIDAAASAREKEPKIKAANTSKKRRRPKKSITGKLKSELANVLDRLEVLETIHKKKTENGDDGTSGVHEEEDPSSSSSPSFSASPLTAAVVMNSNNNLGKEEMIHAMDNIQDTLQRLNQTFSTCKQDDILHMEKAVAAATIIITRVKGFLQRKRYLHIAAVIRRFKARNGGTLVSDLATQFFRTHRRRVAAVNNFSVAREENIKEKHFTALRVFTLSSRPERKRIAAECAALRATLEHALLESSWTAWATVAHGPHSHKAVAERFKARYATAREELRAKNVQRPPAQQVLISRENVIEHMNKTAVTMMQDRRGFHTKRIFFKAWSCDAMFAFVQRKKRADNNFAVCKFPRFFNAWQKFVSIVQSEAKIAYVYSPDRFDAVHNDQVIVNFARRTLLTKVMKGWRALTAQNKQVRDSCKQMFQRQLRGTFDAWKMRVTFQRQVKLVCINEWKELQVRRRQTPFRAWYVHAQSMRKKRETQTVLLAAFKRRKTRLIKTRMFKLWAHKAIYGKTCGMHSRADLIKALETQKQMTQAMQVYAVQQKETIAQLEEGLAAEMDRATEQQISLAERDKEIIKVKCAQQQLETEVVRIQCLFDSISFIHPGTAKRLIAVEQSRIDDFKDRGLKQVARRARQKANMINGEIDDGLAGEWPNEPRGPAKPCVKCGYDEVDASIRPQSARLSLHQSKEDDPVKLNDQCVGGLSSDNVVWVTGQDSRIILRTQWARAKLTKMAHKNALEEEETLQKLIEADNNKDVQSSKKQEEKGEILSDKLELEIKNLQSVLAFIFSGNKDDLGYFKAKLTSRLDDGADRAPGTQELCVEQLKRAQLHAPGNWNDFLQGISTHFPLLHPANDDPKKALARRINTQKHNIQQNKLRGLDRKRQNVYQRK